MLSHKGDVLFLSKGICPQQIAFCAARSLCPLVLIPRRVILKNGLFKPRKMEPPRGFPSARSARSGQASHPHCKYTHA